MKFFKTDSELYLPGDIGEQQAFEQTTHLAIAAHQDDVEFMSYSGIAECFDCDKKGFSAAVLTNGSGSPRSGIYTHFTDDQMVCTRQKEQKHAAEIGKYKFLALLMYTSSEVKYKNNNNLINDLANLLKKSNPKIVYTHNLADKHDTHVATAARVITAIRTLPEDERPKKLYGCEVWRGLDWLCDKNHLDCSNMPNLSSKLMEVFDSQISGGKKYNTAIIGRRMANATLADEHEVDLFTEITYAMDLTPLIFDVNEDVTSFISKKIELFKEDVIVRLNKIL